MFWLAVRAYEHLDSASNYQFRFIKYKVGNRLVGKDYIAYVR